MPHNFPQSFLADRFCSILFLYHNIFEICRYAVNYRSKNRYKHN